MSFTFIDDKAMYAAKYVECYTGKYYTDCDTFSEAKKMSFAVTYSYR